MRSIIFETTVDEDSGSMIVKYKTLNKLLDYGMIRYPSSVAYKEYSPDQYR